MLLLYGLLGITAGLVASGFVWLVDNLSELLLARIDGTGSGDEPISLPTVRRTSLLVVPMLGGLASGLLCARMAPEAMGTGTGAVIDAYHHGNGSMRRRAPWVKLVSSVFTIGSGGSAGVEGPIGFIAAGIASTLGRLLHVTREERRFLLMAGFGAGIGAVFHAPMAASIFAAEVLYRDLDLEHEVLVPAIIASTLAYAVFGALVGWDPVWVLPKVEFSHWLQLLPCLVVAAVCAGGGALFVWIHHQAERHLGRNRRIPLWLRPALGGLGVGAVGVFIPHATGTGYAIGQLAIDGSASFLALVLLAIAKMVTSSLTAGSGGSGGLFAPSLVIGGALGGAVALATQALIPELGVQTAAFTVIGMAGFFAAVINAPVSTVIMVSELVGNYRLLVPTLWVCTIAWFLLRRISLYSEQMPTRMQAPGHLADMMGAVLRRITVADIFNRRRSIVTVRPDLDLRGLMEVFSHSTQGVFPIVDEKGILLGVVDGRALRQAIGEFGFEKVLIAQDFRVQALSTNLDESLYSVVKKMAMSGYDDVAVTSRDNPPQLLGVLSRREIITAYNRRMLETSQTEESSIEKIAQQSQRIENVMGELANAIELGDMVDDVDADSWQQAMAETLEHAALPESVDRPALLRGLVEREHLGSTYLGKGIVLPHFRNRDANDSEARVVVSLLVRPVRWDPAATEGESTPTVHTLIIVFGASTQKYLALVSALARSIGDPGVSRLLSRRVSKKRLVDYLRNIEPEKEGATFSKP